MALSKIKNAIDIDNVSINTIIQQIYNMKELEFHKFIKLLLEKQSDKAEIVTYIVYNMAPKCSISNAILYADKYMDKYLEFAIPEEMHEIIQFLSESHENIYLEYMKELDLLDKKEYILALKLIQDIMMAHLVIVNNITAYKNIIFANNIYTLVIQLCSLATKYNFSDNYSGVKFPHEHMQWILNVNSINNNVNIDDNICIIYTEYSNKINNKIDYIYYERYKCYAVTIGLIEFIINFTEKNIKMI